MRLRRPKDEILKDINDGLKRDLTNSIREKHFQYYQRFQHNQWSNDFKPLDPAEILLPAILESVTASFARLLDSIYTEEEIEQDLGLRE